jgi:REP element-mobilizing transposase RayT
MDIYELNSDDLRTRRSIRLPDYDYSQTGHYFVTVNAFMRFDSFGQIDENGIQLNPLGHMIDQAIAYTPIRTPGVLIDTHIVMPDHIHAIMTIDGQERSEHESSSSIPQAVQRLKSYTENQYARNDAFGPFRHRVGHRLWQRSFYEHVIRNDHQLQTVREYIRCNPARRALRDGLIR